MKDVSSYVRGCKECQMHKRPKHPGKSPRQKTDIPHQPFDKVQIDFCGPFPPSVNEGYKYVLAIQDVFSRYSVLIPTKDCSSETAAQMFYEKWKFP